MDTIIFEEDCAGSGGSTLDSYPGVGVLIISSNFYLIYYYVSLSRLAMNIIIWI